MSSVFRARLSLVVILAGAGYFTACSSNGMPAATGTGGQSGSAGTGAGGQSGAAGNDASVTDAGRDTASTDGGGFCSPCNLAIGNLVARCVQPIGACVEQRTDTTNADGTTTTVDNTCYANGAKRLTTKTASRTDGGGSVTDEMTTGISNGATCYSVQVSGTVTSTSEDVTEVIRSPSGATVATLKFTAVLNGTTVSQSETISCDGQTYEPFVLCLPAGAADAGDAGGTVSCTQGTCM